jgi:hypothetical protein
VWLGPLQTGLEQLMLGTNPSNMLPRSCLLSIHANMHLGYRVRKRGRKIKFELLHNICMVGLLFRYKSLSDREASRLGSLLCLYEILFAEGWKHGKASFIFLNWTN